MKTNVEILADMRAALAHHEQEAVRLRAAIAALEGKPVAAPAAPFWPSPMPDGIPPFSWPQPGVVGPWPTPWSPDIYIGDPPPWQQGTIYCGPWLGAFG